MNERQYMESLKERGERRLTLSVVFLFAAFLLPGAAGAAKIHPSAGSTSAAFLKLGIGARASAMGGAFAAVPGDPFAIYWNPAGLAYAGPQQNIGFFHNEYFQGLGQEFLSYSAPAGRGGWGLGLNYFYTGSDLERRSGLNEGDPLSPISPPEGEFGAYDLAFSGGYGRRYAGNYALGAAVKVIRQSIDNERGASAALDLGLMRGFSWRGGDYTAGVSVQNIGPGIKFERRRYDLPLIFRAGLSRRLDERGALLSLEADKPVDNYPSLAAGIEYPLTGRMALRTGYRYRLHGNELGAWSGFSAGAGVAFDRLTFDYAFTPFGVLGNSHRFSINLRFGGAAPAAARAPTKTPSQEAGFTDFLLAASSKPLTISPRGAKYRISAVSAECGIAAMKFTTMLRGDPPTGFPVAEGSPSGQLLAGFPEGLLPLKVWKPGGIPGSVQGDIHFSIRVAKSAVEIGRPVFMFRKGSEWHEVPSTPEEAEPEYYLFSASAPSSVHYALGLKTGD
jgi:hypothetical protein